MKIALSKAGLKALICGSGYDKNGRVITNMMAKSRTMISATRRCIWLGDVNAKGISGS